MRPACLLLLACLLPAVEPSPLADWAAAVQAPGYAEATVAKPGFASRALWPCLDGKEAFTRETWEPPAHLYVWAHPGESGEKGGRRTPHDPWEGRHWTDAATGRPATGIEWGPTTDFLLPASATPYQVSWKLPDQEKHMRTYRHLTVQPGAGWYTCGAQIHGNVWVKRGGSHGNHGSIAFSGTRAAFFRHDNGDPRQTGKEGAGVTQYISHDKAGGGSTELLGALATVDEFRVMAGTLIVGRDSRVMPGRNAVPFIRPQATLALLDGACFGKWCNQIGTVDLLCDGTLQGGLPERPLTRDARAGFSYQNVNGTRFYPEGRKPRATGFSLETRVAPLIVGEGGLLRSVSAEPARARLVVGWGGLDATAWHCDGIEFRRSPPAEQERLRAACDALPKEIVIAFRPGARAEGVRFERILAGGLLLCAGAERSALRDCVLAPGDRPLPDGLFTAIRGLDRNGRWE